MMTNPNDGYHPCPCRDCFETAIGTDDDGSPSMCSDCVEAGCELDSDCQSPHAYGEGDWEEGPEYTSEDVPRLPPAGSC